MVLLPIGVIIGAHGVRGLVKVKTEAEHFRAFFEEQPITIGGVTRRAKVMGARSSPFIVQIEGVDDRNAAEVLRGQKIYVETSHVPALDATQFVVAQLVGLSVEEHGVPIGTIVRLLNFGAGDIVEIAYTDGRTELFAFNARTFPDIDIRNKRAQINRPLEV